MNPYNAEEFVSMAELKERVKKAREMKHRLRLDLMRETNRIDKEELEQFEYKLAKYMYELKAHARLNKHIDKAVALVTKFRNQKPPENATNEQMKEWERKKLTTAKVLATIRKYIISQNVVPRKEVALVKTSYGSSSSSMHHDCLIRWNTRRQASMTSYWIAQRCLCLR